MRCTARLAQLPAPDAAAHGHASGQCRRRASVALGILALGLGLLAGCAGTPEWEATAPLAPRLEALLPADVLLLGEQHDAPDHQALQRDSVQALAARGQLAALALEMADSGRSSAALPAHAAEAQVRAALGWNDQAWPWAAYGPVVMSAVRAGVPVLGANLPRARMKQAMSDVSLDAQLEASALAAQRVAVREGHCGLLPAAQIELMTRIQIARDREMAHSVAQAVRPGHTVLLVTGRAHADKALGVPQHLPTELRVRSVGLVAGTPSPAPADQTPAFDAIWRTAALPAKDHCANLRERLGRRPPAS